MDREEAPDRIALDIHGVRVLVTSGSAECLAYLRDRLGGYVAPSTDDVKATIAIETTPSFTSPADIREEFSWVRSRPLWGDLEGDVLRLTDGSSVALTRYSKRSAQIFVQAETLRDVPFASRTFLLLPILELLRTFGFFYVHGALLRKGETGILLLGQGGSGKSTLSASLLTSGWKIVGDDNLLFHLVSGVTAVGFPFERELSVSRTAFEQLGLPFTPPADGTKPRIRLEVLPKDLVAEYASPDRIVCLRSIAADQAGPMDGSEIFRALVEENPLLLLSPSLASNHVETIRAIIRNARCRSLSLERREDLDLKEIAARFSRLVGD